MRTFPVRAIALLLCVLMLNAPFAPIARADEKESFGITILKAAGSSAAGKGAEFAVKALGGLIYANACKDKVLQPGDQYMCDVLGGITGDNESAWKKKVEQTLTEINGRLSALEKGQEQIQYELKQQHATMVANFDQAATKVEATHAIVRIENLWEKYQAQFDGVDNDLKRESMVAFAKDIINNNLHTKLGDLNVVLTKATLDGQPLLRYPFYEWRLKKGFAAPPEVFDASEIYDFAEKKFVDFRIQQHKVYVMYLWAASVLESDCKLHPGQCVKPPRSTADFNADYERYTRQQLETFNSGVDNLILSYALLKNDNPRTLPIPNSSEMPLLRANYLTAATMTGGEGLWGRVITMGNAWDGSLEVTCGGQAKVIKPVTKYTTTIQDRDGTHSLDWWTSRSANGVYDEVHFAREWTVNLYQLAAKEGPCKVNTTLPNRGGILPWAQTDTEVVKVKTPDNRDFLFGSFVAIQRAGGTYALASGNWKRAGEPRVNLEGKAQRENVRYDWTITTDRRGAPWISLLYEGDGEWKIANGSSRVHNQHQIYLSSEKKIYFPEGGKVKFNMVQGAECAKVCRGSNGSDYTVLNYDVWNNDTDAKKGWMNAQAAIYFDTRQGDPNSINNHLRDQSHMGIRIDQSYGKTGDQKTANVSGDQSVTISPDKNTGYYLQYLIDFNMESEGRFTNKTYWMYRAKLTPYWLWLSQY